MLKWDKRGIWGRGNKKNPDFKKRKGRGKNKD